MEAGPTTPRHAATRLRSCPTQGPWGDQQVPVKLIDAMHAAVPAVITPRPPLLWAAGGTSVVVADGRASEIATAFRLIADDADLAKALRARHRRQRAVEMFTPKAAAPHLLAALDRADAQWQQRTGLSCTRTATERDA